MARRSNRGVAARRALDRRLTRWRDLGSAAARPTAGWVRALREALGMTADDLGERVGLDGSTVRRLELSERDRRIQLDTLDRLARALNCEVVYALVPRQSLEQTVDEQAMRVALTELARMDHTMRLEAQGVTEGQRERAEDLARELKNRPGLWHSAASHKLSPPWGNDE